MKLGSDASARGFAALAALAYLGVGLAWIAFSDPLGELLFASRAGLVRYQTWKGAAFISLTAVLIYLLLQRRYRPEAELPAAGAAPPVRLLLSAVLLLAMAPLVGLVAWNLSGQTREALRSAESLVARVVATTAAGVESHFLVRQQLLQAVAEQAAMGDEGAVQACGRLLATAMAMQSPPLAVAVVDASGSIQCGAALEPAGRMPRPGQAVAPQVGAPYRTPEGRWVFDTLYPLRDAHPHVAVRVTLPTDTLESLIRAPLPLSGAVALVHGSGRLLARVPDRELVGAPVHAASLREAESGAVLVAPGRDGEERVYAARRLPSLDLTVIVGVASSEIHGPVRQAALQAALVGLLVVLAGGFVVGRVARHITQPMAALAQTAERVAAGQFDSRAPEAGPREIVRVAQQFNAMLDRLPALERQLRDSEERHRTLLQKLSHNVPGMIFQLRMEPDGSGTMPFASDALQSLFELRPDEVARSIEPLRARVHPEDEARVYRLLEESRTTLCDFAVDYRVRLPQAGERHHLMRAQPERQEDGSVLWHGCTVDVTELEQARAELERLNAELEARVRERTAALAAANEALESFSWSIAHDLRAPLAALDGFSTALPGVIARGDTGRAEHLASRIAANARKMSAMVDGLLALSRAGRGQPQDVEQDLRAMAMAVAAELQGPPALVLKVGELPVARVDPTTMRQVFWNLMANAVKFSARREQPRVEVGCKPAEGGGVTIYVRDNGAGFDPARADRLFGVFQRLHDEQTYAGTGVGLAIVRRVVEWHGGRVHAEGAVEAGATFSFTLPAQRIVRL